MQKTALVSTVKAPIHELLMFVHYHLNLGVDEILLYFDDPHDPGIAALSPYNRVTTIPCTPEYWSKHVDRRPVNIVERQMVNINNGCHFATEKGCRWLIHIDSDELIYTLNGLKETLETCQADALRFCLLEAVGEQEHYDHIFMPSIFKKAPNRLQIWAAKCLGCTRAVVGNNYFKGHLASKMAIKISPKIHRFGIHGPLEYDESIVIRTTTQLCLLHYDCVGFENWVLKWTLRQDDTNNHDYMSPQRVKQFQEFMDAREKGTEALSQLYRRRHIIPDNELKILSALRMVKRVDLDLDMFHHGRSIKNTTY